MLFVSLKKHLSFWRYLNFCSDFFGHVGNGFISRSKGNQTMKFCQLIEYKIRNTFLEKPYKTHCEETSPGPFSKKQKLSISLDCCMSKSKLSKCIETKAQTTSFYLIWSYKQRSRTSLAASFSAPFLKKNISHIKFY